MIPNNIGKAPKSFVSFNVAFLSIEIGKPIDADERQRASMAVSLAPTNLLRQVSLEKAMIIKPGKAVQNRSLDLLFIYACQVLSHISLSFKKILS
jgi:hypothetical protein